jgi:DNA-binding winged helix-turn-helix (wHTH) protein
MATPAHPRRFYQFGPFRLDASNRVLLREGDVVPLSSVVVETLRVLVANRGNPVTKEELLKAVWPDTFVEESNLTHNISVLRKALGEEPGEQRFIQTIPKRGYRFVAAVSEVGDMPSGESLAPGDRRGPGWPCSRCPFRTPPGLPGSGGSSALPRWPGRSRSHTSGGGPPY